MRHNTLFILIFITCNSYGSNNPKDKMDDILPQGLTSKVAAGYRFHAVNFVPKPHPTKAGHRKFMMKNTSDTGFELNEVQKKSMDLGNNLSKPLLNDPIVQIPSTKAPDTHRRKKAPSILDVNESILDPQVNNNIVKRHVFQPSKTKKPCILDIDMQIPAVQETPQNKRTLDDLTSQSDSKRTKVEESPVITRQKLTMADILSPE